MTEARLAARRQARAEARENRLRDSENKFTKDSDGGERLTDFLGNSLRNTTGTSGCKTATREVIICLHVLCCDMTISVLMYKQTMIFISLYDWFIF